VTASSNTGAEQLKLPFLGTNNSTNKPLFSQHYLKERIQEHQEWGEDVESPFQNLKVLYETKKTVLPNLNEAQTEQEFIRPVLDILGFAYSVQTSVKRAGRVMRPDYTLFPNANLKSEADHQQQDETAFYSRAIAVADAKYWGRSLNEANQNDSRDSYKNVNPSFQIVNYLTGTGVDWAILTNGHTWRIYSRQASSMATEFYEINLVALLTSNDPEPFKYFWFFFRHKAFIRDAQGRNFLERVREGSATYARVIGDLLKEMVFQQVFPLLAGGFVRSNAEQDEDITSEVALNTTYAATLALLYKMLFLLYAEARNLLPMDNVGYQAQSLTRIAQEVAQKRDRKVPLGQTSTAYCDQLLNLFRLIDRGDQGLGVPRYNGGLFSQSSTTTRFLRDHRLTDAELAPALDQLARIKQEPIDYGFINVRHLGAIYEGLLEYRVVVEEAKKGKVHLENDRGERHATGSYYTPEYVVKYIVRQALSPVLQERATHFDELMNRIGTLRAQLQDGRISLDSGSNLRDQLGRLELLAVETLLDIKVCDPAMGSGHFLVEAVDYLTDELITILNQYPEENPVLKMLERTRQEIIANLTAQNIQIDPIRLNDTQLLQRVILKRCIYGVDLNAMAVELAKVSLWLHSFTVGAPLSFLDHHLRYGNSLVGAMARQTEAEMSQFGPAGQMSFLSGPFAGLLQAANIMQGISLLSDATFTEVEQSQTLFQQFDKEASNYKRLLDIYVARHFGIVRTEELLHNHTPDELLTKLDHLGDPYTTVVQEVRLLQAEKRFFHWDLEFPEVFIDLEHAAWKENGGFEAVIGNPPYVRQELLAALKPYFKAAYPDLHSGTADLFVYFFGQGMRLIGEEGCLSYISSNSWLRANYAKPLRAFLRTKTTLAKLIDLGDNRVFADALDVYPAILVVSRQIPTSNYSAQVAVFTRGEEIQPFEERVATKLFSVTIHDQPDNGWQLGDDAGRQVFQKILAKGTPLGDVVTGQIYSGVKTGLNEAFIVDQTTRDKLIADDPSCEILLKPILRGEDLRPWYQEDNGRWLIFLPDGWTNNTCGIGLSEEEAWNYLGEKHPSIVKHLALLADAGRKRTDKGTFWWELRPCVYYPAFSKPKIFWPDITRFPRFSWDTSGFYVGNTGYILVTEETWLLGFLASRCAWFLISKTAVGLGERAGFNRYRLIDQYMRPLPTPNPTQTEREAIGIVVMKITQVAQTRYKLHRKTRHRILTDLAAPDAKLNQKLTAWWELGFGSFSEEIKKVFKRTIPLRERDDWEEWFTTRREEDQRLTAEIIRLETELNNLVYKLFELTPNEIKIIEQSTKYQYGEV